MSTTDMYKVADSSSRPLETGERVFFWRGAQRAEVQTGSQAKYSRDSILEIESKLFKSDPTVSMIKPNDYKDSFLNKMMKQLAELLLIDSEGEISPPSERAFTETFDILVEIANRLQGSVPFAPISIFDGGGLRIEWVNGDRHVRVVVPGSDNERGYIFHQDLNNYDVDWNLNSHSVVKMLEWCFKLNKDSWI